MLVTSKSRNTSQYVDAVCPGGEGAVLKIVELKGFAGSNPVDGARAKAPTAGPLCR